MGVDMYLWDRDRIPEENRALRGELDKAKLKISRAEAVVKQWRDQHGDDGLCEFVLKALEIKD